MNDSKIFLSADTNAYDIYYNADRLIIFMSDIPDNFFMLSLPNIRRQSLTTKLHMSYYLQSPIMSCKPTLSYKNYEYFIIGKVNYK